MALSQGLRQVQKQTQSLVLAPQLSITENSSGSCTGVTIGYLEELQTNPLLEEIGGNDEAWMVKPRAFSR